MTLSVLTDDQIEQLLDNLTPDELESFRQALKEALHEYSLGTQSRTSQDDEQPERQVVHSTVTGATTLFMPSRAPAGMGVKVITLTPPPKSGTSPSADAGLAASAAPAPTPTQPPPLPVLKPTGAITLFSPQGQAVALLHASHLTAFRTALASLCLVQRREQVKVVTVFGCGLQAYYHVRLTLMSRGSTIKHVNIVSHRFSPSVAGLLARFVSGIPASAKAREGWSDCKFGVITPSYSEYYRLLKEQVRAADVIFCCTPSTKELFPASFLTNNEGRRKKRGRLVVAIGSYSPDMIELPKELLLQATKRQEGEGSQFHFHKHAPEGGVVIVDTLEGALKEAGEVIAAGLRPDQLVELGELVMLRRIALEEEEQQQQQGEDDDGMVNSPTSLEFEKLDLGNGGGGGFQPAMATVFGGGDGTSGGGSPTALGPSSRSSSPSRGTTTTTATTGRTSGDGSSISTFHTSSTFGSGSSKRSTSRGSGGGRSASKGHKRMSSADLKKKQDETFATWLQAGNVIYKSVGMGLMDLAVGMHLVQFAREKGVGTHVEGF